MIRGHFRISKDPDNGFFVVRNFIPDAFCTVFKATLQDEELYRNAERLTVRYLDEYQKKYSNLSYQEILILVAFHMVVAVTKTAANENIEPLADKIKELDNELKQILNEK